MQQTVLLLSATGRRLGCWCFAIYTLLPLSIAKIDMRASVSKLNHAADSLTAQLGRQKVMGFLHQSSKHTQEHQDRMRVGNKHQQPP